MLEDGELLRLADEKYAYLAHDDGDEVSRVAMVLKNLAVVVGLKSGLSIISYCQTIRNLQSLSDQFVYQSTMHFIHKYLTIQFASSMN